MTDPIRNRTLRWRDADDRTRLSATSEAELVRLMRERSHDTDATDDAAYMQAVARRFQALDGVTIRADSVANFVEDLIAVGQVEAIWVDADGNETWIAPDAYRIARLRALGLPIAASDDPPTSQP